MMTADEARHRSLAAHARLAREESERRAREKEAAAQRDQEILARLPMRRAELEALIDGAAERGNCVVVFRFNEDERVVADALYGELRSNGYGCTRPESRSEEVDHGDFNAPCVMTERWLEFKVSW